MGAQNVVAKPQRPAFKQVNLVTRAENAKEVVVAGEFNNWSEEGIRLAADSNGEWRTTLKLPPGEYQYRLRVDGQWRDHPEAQKRVPNPFGTENCVLCVM